MLLTTPEIQQGVVPLLCEQSPAYWATQFLWNYEDNIPFQIGGKHHIEWSEMVMKYDRICNLTHRDGGKSYFFSFAFILWHLYFEKGDVYLFSNTEKQAVKLLAIIQDQILKNDKLAHMRPVLRNGKKPKWSATEAETPGGMIYALGYGTSVRGAHPYLVICDDILTDENMYSVNTRKRAIEYFKSAVTNLIRVGGKIVVVGTPFHISDLYGYLKKNEEYIFRVFPAIGKDKDGNDESLWPARYPLDLLRAREREIGKLSFSREFQCCCLDDSASMFPFKVLSKCYDDTATLSKTFSGGEVYMGVDVAISAEIEADGTAIITVYVDEMKNIWLLDVFYEFGIDMKQQQDAIKDISHRYNPTRIFVESNSYQQALLGELKRTTNLPVVAHRTGSQKNSFDKGVPKIRTMMDNGKIKIPRGDDYSIEKTAPLIEQLSNFGFVDGKVRGVGDHDDLPMALWMAIEASLHRPWSFEFIG